MADGGGITRRAALGAGGLGLAAGLAAASTPGQGSGPSKVMVIRHAEKPSRDGGPPFGVDPEGRRDVDALLVRGWERAGALARLFAPVGGGLLPAGLARPSFLAAAAATPEPPSGPHAGAPGRPHGPSCRGPLRSGWGTGSRGRSPVARRGRADRLGAQADRGSRGGHHGRDRPKPALEREAL